MKQSIQCSTTEQFYDVIYNLVVKGLTFRANVDTLIVELLGGY